MLLTSQLTLLSHTDVAKFVKFEIFFSFLLHVRKVNKSVQFCALFQ